MLKRTWRFVPIACTAACYSYTPIQPAAAPPGIDVRARITGAAFDRVAPMLGTFDSRILVGNVIENNNGSMTLEVPNGSLSNVPTDVVQTHARIPLSPGDLVSLEQRKLDKPRTILLAGSIVAVVAAAATVALRSGADPQPGNITPEPPPINRIPIFRIAF
jgi:hypothetical protein